MANETETDAGPNPENLMKILVASDIHLGFNEKDTIRGDDSFIAFEEILQIAVEKEVDFILLGGDLFHDATPSQNALHKCVKLLRTYTLGDKPISLEFLSDQAVNFVDAINQTVNYEDPNLNVSIPVFSIHGNHDDPSGFGRLSSLDILSSSGLINYFGKWVDLTKVDINPIMLKKGETQLALYGLSHIHDNRLVRLFHNCKVVMEKPDPKTGEWFNIMVLHQNRADRGPKNYVPEEILPDFLDLVIWGHEHDCRIFPEENYKKNFFVVQPGSSVATSLADGEALDKHVGLLVVHKKQFKLDPIPLKTIRPFIYDCISLADYAEDYNFDEGDVQKKVIEIATRKVEEMITKAEEKISGHEKQPWLPLIRLKIIYTEEEQMFNAIRFGQQFNERIANPTDVILLKRMARRVKSDGKGFDKSVMEEAFDQENISHETRVEQVVDRYFENVEDSKKLQIMSSKILSEMCWRLVDRNDANAAENIIKFCKEKANDFLMEKLPTEDQIDSELLNFKEKSTEMYDAVLKMLDDRGSRSQSTTASSLNIGDGDETVREPAKRSTRGGSRGVGESSRATTRGRGRGRGRARGAAAQKSDLDIAFGRADERQLSIQDSFSQRTSQRQKKAPQIVYDISDSD